MTANMEVDLKELTSTVANEIVAEFDEDEKKDAERQKKFDNFMKPQLIDYLKAKLTTRGYTTRGVNEDGVFVDIIDSSIPRGMSLDYNRISDECLNSVSEMFGFKSLEIKQIGGSITFKITIPKKLNN